MQETAKIEEARSLSDRVREILPALEDLVARGEKERAPPDAQVRLFTQAGMWRHFVPKCYGGDEGSVYDWLQAVRLIGSVDMSAAWVAGLASCHAPPITFFDERVQDEIWGRTPDVVFATAGAPPAQGIRVEGGVVMKGRMGFASGCDSADWLLTYFRETDAAGEPRKMGVLLPRADVRIEDTWHVSGMRATGSNTVVLDDVFAPDHRIAPFMVGIEGPVRKSNAAPLYRLSHFALFGAAFGPLMVGGMERALRIARDAMKTKVSATTGKASLDNIPSQLRFAQSLLKAEAAIALADKRWRELDAQAMRGETESIQDFHRWKAIDHHVAQIAVEVVEELMNSSSPSAHYDSFPLQRFWRDIRQFELVLLCHSKERRRANRASEMNVQLYFRNPS